MENSIWHKSWNSELWSIRIIKLVDCRSSHWTVATLQHRQWHIRSLLGVGDWRIMSWRVVIAEFSSIPTFDFASLVHPLDLHIRIFCTENLQFFPVIWCIKNLDPFGTCTSDWLDSVYKYWFKSNALEIWTILEILEITYIKSIEVLLF